MTNHCAVFWWRQIRRRKVATAAVFAQSWVNHARSQALLYAYCLLYIYRPGYCVFHSNFLIKIKNKWDRKKKEKKIVSLCQHPRFSPSQLIRYMTFCFGARAKTKPKGRILKVKKKNTKKKPWWHVTI